MINGRNDGPLVVAYCLFFYNGCEGQHLVLAPADFLHATQHLICIFLPEHVYHAFQQHLRIYPFGDSVSLRENIALQAWGIDIKEFQIISVPGETIKIFNMHNFIFSKLIADFRQTVSLDNCHIIFYDFPLFQAFEHLERAYGAPERVISVSYFPVKTRQLTQYDKNIFVPDEIVGEEYVDGLLIGRPLRYLNLKLCFSNIRGDEK